MAKSNTFPINVQYGRENHKISIELDWRVKDLSQYFWDTFCIPVDKKKIIHQGKILSDPDAPVSSLKLKAKSKLMLLGDPVVISEDDQRVLQEISEKVTELSSEVSEIHSRISEGVVKGFLPKPIQPAANVGHLKSLRVVNGQCMKMLDSLDSILASPKDTAFKEKRKSLISRIYSLLDDIDSSSSLLEPSQPNK